MTKRYSRSRNGVILYFNINQQSKQHSAWQQQSPKQVSKAQTPSGQSHITLSAISLRTAAQLTCYLTFRGRLNKAKCEHWIRFLLYFTLGSANSPWPSINVKPCLFFIQTTYLNTKQDSYTFYIFLYLIVYFDMTVKSTTRQSRVWI